MAISCNDAVAHDILNSINTDFDGGTLEFRTGARPAQTAAATGTVVASVPIAADSFAAAGATVARQMAANGLPWEDTAADNAGTIAWARMRNAGNTKWLDFNVTQTGGGGDITVDNTVLAAGQDFKVTAFTISYP